MRVNYHPILGKDERKKLVKIVVDGREMMAVKGEPIAAVLLANGIRKLRKTRKKGEYRGVFCGIGRCTDCAMIVDEIPNIRTCITPVKEGMQIITQEGLGKWERK